MKSTDYAVVEKRLFTKAAENFRRYHRGATSDITDIGLTREEKLLISRFELDLQIILDNCVGVVISPLTDKTNRLDHDTIYHVKTKLTKEELVSIIPSIKPFLTYSKTKVMEYPINIYSSSEHCMETYYVFNFSFRNVYLAVLKWLGHNSDSMVKLNVLTVLSIETLKVSLEKDRDNVWKHLVRNKKDIGLFQNQVNELYRLGIKGRLNILNAEDMTDFDLLINHIKECKAIAKDNLGDFTSPLLLGGMVYRYFRHVKSIDNFPMRNLSENLTNSQKETLFGEIVVEELVRFKFDTIIGSFLDGWNYEARIATQTSVSNQT